MARFALSAIGADRPGIVAGVSGALVELGCNLEDSTMTILQGHFAILLVVSGPDERSAADLEAALEPVIRRFELVATVRPFDDATSSASPGVPYTVSVHGADRTGIVHAVTKALAEVDGNVADLATHLVGTPDAPVYVMTLRVTLPGGDATAAAVTHVRDAAESLGVHCSVHPDESDTL